MSRRIVLFGASGYTGRLVAEALVRARARPVLAGRSHQNLAALGVLLGKGLDIAVADVANPDSLQELLRPGDVLINTVGPFARFGRPVVEAAILRRATYIDSTGEPSFIRTVYEELGPMAAQAGVPLLTAAAYEYAAGDLAAALVLEAVGNLATRVDIAYFFTGARRGAFSRGTRASTGGAALTRHHAWRDRMLVPTHAADRVQSFPLDGESRAGIAIGGAEHYSVPRRLPFIREVNVYLAATRNEGTARMAGRAVAAGSAVPGVPQVAELLTRLPRSKAGPTAEEREHTGAAVMATAFAADGRRLRGVELRGANPYAYTAELLSWIALQLSKHGTALTGAVSPVDVFGTRAMREASAAAGLPVVSWS